MDSQITAAALALASGDPLAALKWVSLRDDAPALALRGIAMAQLGDLARARELLGRAIRAFGPREARARARCVIAQAEVALAARELNQPRASLLRAREVLEASGDQNNAVHARCLDIRRSLLLGHVAQADAALGELDLSGAPPMLVAVGELLRAGVAIRTSRSALARAALLRADAAARRSGIAALVAEVESARRVLEVPAARLHAAESTRTLVLQEVEALLASPTLVVDACRRVVRRGARVISLRRRPVLFALARALAEACPDDMAREPLLERVFGARRPNASHRARLRVEMGRLRRALAELARVEATPAGFVLQPLHDGGVCVLSPPLDHEYGDVLALLADGQSWSSSALALALGTSQRSVQRALIALQGEGKARALGDGRARRWLAAPIAEFTTVLLLPRGLPLD